MQRHLSILAALLLAACGGGGGGPDAGPILIIELTAVDVPLDGLGATAYEIHGANFPGLDGATFNVRFVSASGPIFDDCVTTEILGTVTRASDAILRGTTPATHVLATAQVFVTVEFPDGPITSDTAIATFIGTPDPSQDQDGNGLRDGCDPRTYDFEQDAPGVRPGDTTQLGYPTTVEVADVAGDRVARYTGASQGTHDRFDRLLADHPHQDTTVYVDWDDDPGVGSIELWSEGSFSDNAGGGLIVQVRTGLIYFFERTWRSVPAVVGPALPANGRMRIRVRKGPGTTSAVHIDEWTGSTWSPDLVVFPITDDSFFRGRNTVLAEYSGGLRGVKRITAVHELPSAPLALLERPEGLVPWKLFQRSSAGSATIPVDVSYRLATAGTLQARVVRSDNGLLLPGHDWTDHTRSLSAADWARAHLDLLGVPTGGNYDVHVRLLDDSDALVSQLGVHNVAIGDVYICAGQSNMSGYSGNLTGATEPIPEVHRYHNDGTWGQATEPADASLLQLDRISLENPLHSLMLPFGRALYAATGVPVAVVPTSLGGTNLYAQWQRNAVRPDWRATLYGSMRHRAQVATGGAAPAGFLWFQGESDSLAGRTTAEYVADLEQLLAQVRSDLAAPDLPAVVAQLGTYSAAPLDLWLGTQEAERQVAASDPLTALVTTVDQTRSDAIHFSVAGYQQIGVRFADAMRVLQFGHAIDPLAELVTVAPGAASDEIVLTYDAPVSGGATHLYAATDDTGALTVTAIQVSGSSVTLTVDRALDTGATLTYGRSVDPLDTWVVDANGIPVPCFDKVSVN